MSTGSLSRQAVAMTIIGLLATSSSQAKTGQAGKPAPSPPTATQTKSSAARWVNKVWRVTAPTDRAPGSFYIFLSDGTLVMTSCVETYRLATWRAESDGRIRIAEDKITRYHAEIRQVSDRQLSLRLDLKNEQVALTLEAADVPYVCPDLRR